jgi:anti-sigma-K factor RskA
MSDKDDMKPTDVERDDPMIAAEFSLGLLEGEELLAARGRMASDKDFAWRKQWWDDWFVPLSDQVGGAEPSAEVWARIQDEIAARAGGANVVAASVGNTATAPFPDRNVIDLQSRLRRWQWTAGITSAAAAIALAVMVFAPGSNPVSAPETQLAASDPLMASVPIGDTGLRLDVTYLPESERMMVTAIGLTPDGVHDHELWLVPAKGDLQSLGVVKPGEVVTMTLPKDVARNILDGAEVKLTREPLGGKPADKAAGPVVAEGAFNKV